MRCVDGLPGLYRQEQAGEGILRGHGAGLRHGLSSRLDQGCGTSDPAKTLASCSVPDASTGCVGGYPATLKSFAASSSGQRSPRLIITLLHERGFRKLT